MYTLEEVAKIVRKSKMTVYRHIWDKKLEANKVGGTWLITQEQLEKYIKGE